ncbi:MAG: hypothetical protein WCD21_25590 [Streptomyces sp.]
MAQDIADFASLSWPCAPAAVLDTLTRWSAFCFLLDDALDDEHSLDRSGQRATLTAHVEEVRNHEQPSKRPPLAATSGGPFVAAFSDVWAPLAASMDRAWQVRFTGHCLAYLQATAQEAHHRETGCTPAVGAYLQLRRHSSGSLPHLDLIEYATARPRPHDMLAGAAVRNATDAAADLAAWDNDQASLAKELEAGEIHNLIVLTAREHACSHRQAQHLVAERLHQRQSEFETATRVLSSRGGHRGREYAQALRAWLDGIRTWNARAHRYQPRPADAVR